MYSRSLSRLIILFALMLSSCGDLPEPFLGNPGAVAQRLAVPVTPAMLAVPPPRQALLNDASRTDFADLLAVSLQREDIPSLARVPRQGDWRLAVTAERKGDAVVPRYAIQNPSGKELGAIDGAAFPAASWTAGAPWTLGQAAKDAVPKVVALMLTIRNANDRANPNSLLNRPARLYVPEVTGAPGDGNAALTRLVRARLADLGPLIQSTQEGADFFVIGRVTVTPIANGQQRVEIVWTVTRPSGVVNGKVSQLNNVPAGSLDAYWGDIASVVASEASGGIFDVVERFIGRDTPPGGPPTKAAGPAAGPVAATGSTAGGTATAGATPPPPVATKQSAAATGQHRSAPNRTSQAKATKQGGAPVGAN